MKQYPPLVAEIDGKAVGRVVLEAIYPPFGELQNMSVLPEFRGRGVGGALVDECISQLARKGFLAAFLQTHFDNLTAQRLYARKGFIVAAKGVMLRLVRFINLPILDRFFYDHPVALYHGPSDAGQRQSPLVRCDWITGDRLEVTLTGGSNDKDSEEYGPGISAVDMTSKPLSFSAQLSGPLGAARRKAN